MNAVDLSPGRDVIPIVPEPSTVSRRDGGMSEALWVVAGQATAAIGSVVGVRILTDALHPTDYGQLALSMTAATLGLQVILAPLMTAALRFFSAAQEVRDLGSFLAAVRSLLAKSVTAIAIVAFLITTVVVVVSGTRWLPLISASFAFTVFWGTSSVLDGIQNAARQRMIVAWHDGLAPWLRFGLAIALIAMWSRASSSVAMTGYASASAIVLASQFHFFRVRIRALVAAEPADAEGRRVWMQKIIAYGRPFMLWGVFTWAQLASDRWALGSLVSTSDVGLYAAIYQLSFFPMLMLSQVLIQFAGPVLFEKAGDASDSQRLRSSIRSNSRLVLLVLGLTTAGSVIAFALHGWIAQLLLAPSYRAASHFFPWMVLAGGLYATAQTASLFFMLRNESHSLLLPKIGTAILAVALNFAGARIFGAAGVVGAGVVFGLVYLSWVLILVVRSSAKDTTGTSPELGEALAC